MLKYRKSPRKLGESTDIYSKRNEYELYLIPILSEEIEKLGLRKDATWADVGAEKLRLWRIEEMELPSDTTIEEIIQMRVDYEFNRISKTRSRQ